MQRAYSVNNVLNAKFKGLPFDGAWFEAIGKPQVGKSWSIWGQSGSGKTTFNMMLAKYFSQFERVIYNSLEEGLSMSIQKAYNKVNLTEKDNVILVNEDMKTLTERLHKHKSPNIVFLDSLKYTKIRNWEAYQNFCNLFPNKILVWVMHAQGKEPKGGLASDIRYDSMVKIYTEGYRAFITSRYAENSTGHIDIWKKQAKIYYGEI